MSASRLRGLKCRECGQQYPISPANVCEFCFGPLEVDYDYDVIRAQISREQLADGPQTIWRYRALLPVEGDRVVDLKAGFTPLIHARRLGQRLGLRNLYLKNDTANPTWSFKDRVVTVALSKAIEFGFDTVACASTGNLANAVAAHAAHAGLKCYVFIPSDLETGKITGALVYGPEVIGVRGNYDEVNRLCSEISDRYPWAFVNINIRPFYSEGSKTLAYEVVEQLGWRAPDQVVVPIASGSLLTKIHKGLNELVKVGLIEQQQTKINGAQADGCSPVVTAFQSGTDNVKPVRPGGIAKSLAIGNPADGFYAVRTMRETGGYAESVSDDEIIAAIRLLGETEGIFTETAGGVTVGVLQKLVSAGRIGADETVVAYITGCGLKTQEAVNGFLNDPYAIEPNVAAFQHALNL